MDQMTIKTPKPKYRLYWCLLEFIDWRYSQSMFGYFQSLLWTGAPLTSHWLYPPPPIPPSLCEWVRGMSPVLFIKTWERGLYRARAPLLWPGRGLQGDVVYLCWPIAPLYVSPNAREGESCGVSANEYSCTGAQINFGDLAPYLTSVARQRLFSEPYMTVHFSHLFIDCTGYNPCMEAFVLRWRQNKKSENPVTGRPKWWKYNILISCSCAFSCFASYFFILFIYLLRDLTCGLQGDEGDGRGAGATLDQWTACNTKTNSTSLPGTYHLFLMRKLN